MGIDASIYSNVQTPQINIPSALDSAEKGMRLSQMGMQQAQMGQQMRTQAAVRQAYANNTDPNNGQVNREGFLSQLGKENPMAAQEYQGHFIAQDKAAAEAKNQQMQAAHQTLSVTTPALQYLLGLPDDQAAKAFPNVMQQLKDQGVPLDRAPPSWDRGWAQQGYSIGSKMKEGLENQLAQSNIGQAQQKFNNELYGSRGANAEITSQYDQQAKPVRGSQLAMNQMLDNYKNPSPQGDASLVLNAYKIKFPDKPDVNSIEELTKSQDVGSSWKNKMSQALNGQFTKDTRDNLMRDGISTFRANVDTLRGYQKKYTDKAQAQNVPGAQTITPEPAVDKTYSDAMDLQKSIGPYVPPSQRGGMMANVKNAISQAVGIGNNESTAQASQSSNASQKMAASAIKPGDVHKGYVFNGGDPSDPKNWKKR